MSWTDDADPDPIGGGPDDSLMGLAVALLGASLPTVSALATLVDRDAGALFACTAFLSPVLGAIAAVIGLRDVVARRRTGRRPTAPALVAVLLGGAMAGLGVLALGFVVLAGVS